MDTNLHKLFKTNESYEKEGIWIEIEGTPVSFRIKRWGGENGMEVKKAMLKYYKPIEKQVQLGLLPQDKEKRIMYATFVDACLVDWKGVEEKGVEIPFSKENAIKLFTDLPSLYELVFSYATEVNSFKDELGKD